MNYVQYVNSRLKSALGGPGPVVCFGQNISAGSCLSGLTRNLPEDESHIVLNTPNIENSLVGVGFGLMLRGVSSAFFMKQQDFLLLGIDQLANTYNFVRLREPRASFTVFNITVDCGYQGMQSSLNNLFDFCSIARVEGYTMTNRHDAGHLIATKLVSPGFRILSVSQRLFGQELLSVEGDVQIHGAGSIFQYARGEDVTMACFNFSFPQGLQLYRDLRERDVGASLFSVNAALPCDWSVIGEDVSRTRRLIILDDSKSSNVPCTQLAAWIQAEDLADQVLIRRRELSDSMLYPNSDEFSLSADDVLEELNVKC